MSVVTKDNIEEGLLIYSCFDDRPLGEYGFNISTITKVFDDHYLYRDEANHIENIWGFYDNDLLNDSIACFSTKTEAILWLQDKETLMSIYENKQSLDLGRIVNLYNMSELDCIRYIKDSSYGYIRKVINNLEDANLYYIEGEKLNKEEIIKDYKDEEEYKDGLKELLKILDINFYSDGEAYINKDDKSDIEL